MYFIFSKKKKLNTIYMEEIETHPLKKDALIGNFISPLNRLSCTWIISGDLIILFPSVAE